MSMSVCRPASSLSFPSSPLTMKVSSSDCIESRINPSIARVNKKRHRSIDFSSYPNRSKHSTCSLSRENKLTVQVVDDCDASGAQLQADQHVHVIKRPRLSRLPQAPHRRRVRFNLNSSTGNFFASNIQPPALFARNICTDDDHVGETHDEDKIIERSFTGGKSVKSIRRDVMECLKNDAGTINLYSEVLIQSYLTCCSNNNHSINDQFEKELVILSEPSVVFQDQYDDVSNSKKLNISHTHPPTSLIPPDHIAFLGIGRGTSRGLESQVYPVLAKERKRRRQAHCKQIILLHAYLTAAAKKAATAESVTTAPLSGTCCNITHAPASTSATSFSQSLPSCSSPVSSFLFPPLAHPALSDGIDTVMRAVSLQTSLPSSLFAQVLGAADAADAWTEYVNDGSTLSETSTAAASSSLAKMEAVKSLSTVAATLFSTPICEITNCCTESREVFTTPVDPLQTSLPLLVSSDEEDDEDDSKSFEDESET